MRGVAFRRWATIAVGVLLVVYTGLTQRQIGVWQDSVSLWERVLARSPGSVTAHNNLAVWLQDQGRDAEALPHLRRAIAAETSPDGARNALRVGCNAHLLLIRAFIALGRPQDVPPTIRAIHAGPCLKVIG